jgi:hypothetical protein
VTDHGAIRTGRSIAKSWNYTEFFPLNWGVVADYQARRYARNGK